MTIEMVKEGMRIADNIPNTDAVDESELSLPELPGKIPRRSHDEVRGMQLTFELAEGIAVSYTHLTLPTKA